MSTCKSAMDCNVKIDVPLALPHSHLGCFEAGSLEGDNPLRHELLQDLFSGLSFQMDPLTMVKKDAVDGFVVLKYGKDDIKKHLHKLFDFVVVGIKDNITIAIYVKFIVSNTKYMSN